MAKEENPRSSKGSDPHIQRADRPELITGEARIIAPSVDLETASMTPKPKNVVKARPPKAPPEKKS